MGGSLRRHVGCDLIDIYPGPGLWSSKLHEVLQPRSHILMEPDEGVYAPFLQNLLSRPNTTFIPKSGIIWSDLSRILDPAYLPHQVEQPPDVSKTPQRNDTLLLTANLAFHPKKRFHSFDSVATLVLFQFLSSIRASSLLQKYGLVRMLLWVGEDDKRTIIARSCQHRRRMAVDGELATDWINEVAGPDEDDAAKKHYGRDHAIDRGSVRRALSRMRAAGIDIPRGRESGLVKEVQETAEKESGQQQAFVVRPYLEELEGLEAAFAKGEIQPKSAALKRLLALRYRLTRELKLGDTALRLLRERDALAAAHEAGEDPDGTLRREREWDAEILGMNKNLRSEILGMRDNLHLFQQEPPVMNWDRRELVPLTVKSTEFFPNAPCSLLDIQPKAMHPLLRAMGPRSSRAGDTFELVLRGMMDCGSEPVSKAIETVWPGAAEGVLPHCPSLRDRSKGGMPLSGYGEISVRTLNETQWVEILDAWMKWPFRPTFPQLVSRMADDSTAELADDDGDGLGETL